LAPCSPSYASRANDFALGYVHAYVYVHEHPLDPSKTLFNLQQHKPHNVTLNVDQGPIDESCSPWEPDGKVSKEARIYLEMTRALRSKEENG
jgi:hypothetical protein